MAHRRPAGGYDNGVCDDDGDGADGAFVSAEAEAVDDELRALEPKLIAADLRLRQRTQGAMLNYVAFKGLDDDDLWPLMPWATQLSDDGLQMVGDAVVCRTLYVEWQDLLRKRRAIHRAATRPQEQQQKEDDTSRRQNVGVATHAKVALVESLECLRFANAARESVALGTSFVASTPLHRRFQTTVAQMLALLHRVARWPAFAALCLPDALLLSDGFADFLTLQVEAVSQPCRETSWGGVDLLDLQQQQASSSSSAAAVPVLFLSAVILSPRDRVTRAPRSAAGGGDGDSGGGGDGIGGRAERRTSAVAENLPFIGRTSRDDAVLGRVLRAGWDPAADAATAAAVEAAEGFQFTEKESILGAAAAHAPRTRRARSHDAGRAAHDTARKALGVFARLTPRIVRHVEASGPADSLLPLEGALAVCRLAHLAFHALIVGLANAVKDVAARKAMAGRAGSGGRDGGDHHDDDDAPSLDTDRALDVIAEWERLELLYAPLAAEVNRPGGFLAEFYGTRLPAAAHEARLRVAAAEQAAAQAFDRAARATQTFLEAAAFPSRHDMLAQLCARYGASDVNLMAAAAGGGKAAKDPTIPAENVHAAAEAAARNRWRAMQQHAAEDPDASAPAPGPGVGFSFSSRDRL